MAFPALDFLLKLLMMAKKTESVFFVDWLLSDRCYMAFYVITSILALVTVFAYDRVILAAYSM